MRMMSSGPFDNPIALERAPPGNGGRRQPFPPCEMPPQVYMAINI
jgi:hypothetical protein